MAHAIRLGIKPFAELGANSEALSGFQVDSPCSCRAIFESAPVAMLQSPETLGLGSSEIDLMLLIISRCAGVFLRNTLKPSVLSLTECHSVLDPDHSCRAAVARLIVWLAVNHRKPCSPETNSYCDASQRLPLGVIVELVHQTARKIEAGASDEWLWKGRKVSLVDIELQRNPSNDECFPGRAATGDTKRTGPPGEGDAQSNRATRRRRPPRRVEPRANKRRPKPQQFLMEPRKDARKRLMQAA